MPYQRMSPVAIDDYRTMYDGAVAEAPPVETAAEPTRKSIRKPRGPEFYKPFHLLLLAYLFFYCSRVAEMIPYLHIGMLIQPLLLIGMFMTGSSKAMFGNRIGRVMTVFTIWVAICVPFSTWRGGSFQILLLAIQALILMFFMAAFLKTLDDCYRVIYVIAVSMAAIGVLTLFTGAGSRIGDPRIGLGSSNETLSDANFLALYLILGLPAIWFAASWKRGFVKLGLILLVAPLLVSAAHTGSRMGLLALAAAMIFYFIHTTNSQRVLLLMGGMLGLVLAVSLLPKQITERFTTFFSPSSAASEEAAQSAETRRMLLMRSIEITFEHPLFGVGPGEFQDAEAKEAQAMGKRGVWHFTHNAYTELSSETGIPGMLLFVIALFWSYWGLGKIRRSYPIGRARKAALAIQMMIIISAIGAFFLSIAYSGILYPIMGLSAAFQVAAARQYKLMKAEA